MENIRNKINNKRIEEIELEKKFLHDLKSKFENNKEEYHEKIKEQELLIKDKNTILESITELSEIEINNTIDKIEEEIVNNNKMITNENRENEEKNKKINDELNELEVTNKEIVNEEKSFKKNVNLKNKKTNSYLIKLKQLESQYKNLDNIVKNINIRQNEYKKKINDNSIKSVIERHNLIQETTFNLNQKKRFLKDKKKLEKNLIEQEFEHSKIQNQRKELRLKMEQEYFDSLNEDNAVKLIENRDENFSKFDIETKKILFFSNNKIEAIKNKLKMGNDFFNFNQQKKIKEKNEMNREISSKLREFNLEKKKYEMERDQLKNDITFIQKSINIQHFETNEYYNDRDFYFNTKKKEILDKKEEITLQLNENLNLMNKNINELQNRNVLLNKNIENIKDKYYKDKRNNKERKNKIKNNCKKINLEKKKIEREFQDFVKDYHEDKKNIENRIKYLEKKSQ